MRRGGVDPREGVARRDLGDPAVDPKPGGDVVLRTAGMGHAPALPSMEANSCCGSRAALPTGYQAYDLYQLDAGAEK